MDDTKAEEAGTDAADMAALQAIAARVTKRANEMPPLATPGRRLVKEGVLLKKGTKSMLRSVNRRHVFVFNDLVLLMSDDKGDKLHFHQAIPLANAHLRDLMYANALDNSFPDNSFELMGPARSYVLFAETPDEKQQWVAAIKRSMMELARVYTPDRTARRGWHHDLVEDTLWWAAIHGDVEVMTQLMHFADAEDGERVGRCSSYAVIGANTMDEDNVRPIHYAAVAGHAEIVRMLIEHEADRNATDPDMLSPLQLAVKHAQFDVMKVLLDNEADTESTDMFEATALINVMKNFAVDAARPRIVGMLLACGADVDAVDVEGCTALHVAAAAGAANAIVQLCENEANVGAIIPRNSHTALHEAVVAALKPSSVDTVRLLLRVGCQPNARNVDGDTPLHLAVKSLVDATTDDPQITGEIIHLLMANGARADVANKSGDKTVDTVQHMIKTAGMTSLWTSMQASEAEFVARLPPAKAADARTANKLHRYCPDHMMEPDSCSTTCQLCRAVFSFRNRRHHCRSCGQLLCGSCSRKQFPLFNHSKTLVPKTRVCDGCFNRLCDETTRRPAPNTFSKMPPPDTAAQRVELLGPGAGSGAGAGAGAGSTAARGSDARTAGLQGGVSDTKAALERAHQAVNERGERINILNEKVEQLANASEDFAKQCEEIARRAQRGGL